MEMKQLQMNVSKCGTLFFGKKKEVEKIRSEIEESKCLTINSNPVPFKITEKYLGDFFHCEGLAKSAETTVNKRFGLALNSVIELKCVIEDFRMHKLGGINCGLEIFNIAILPALLYNSETWFEIADTTIDRLDRLQLILLRNLFAVPSSTPIPALSWDSGQLSMKHKINEKKLNFIYFLGNLNSSVLAKQVYETQKLYNFPGFIPEAKSLLKFYDLPNIIDEKHELSKFVWKKRVREAIKIKYEEELKSRMSNYSKLKGSPLMNENWETRSYIQDMRLEDARTNFRMRCSMLRTVKMNQKSNEIFARELWACNQCGKIDSQSHIMWCPALASLREGLNIDNDVDVVHYFQKVISLREA